MKSKKQKIGITGSSGTIGNLLVEAWMNKHELIGYDKNNTNIRINSYLFDLAKHPINGIFSGLHTLVHLAAEPSPFAPWKIIREQNFEMTRRVFSEALQSDVKKIIFASSNHVQNGYVADTSPVSMNPDFYKQKRLIRLQDPAYPDSLYGSSKLFGEQLGTHYSQISDMQFIALRIGWVTKEDDPLLYKGKREEAHMRAMFLSKRDCVEAFNRALECKEKSLIAYAISNNDKRIFDLEETKEKLSYNPRDNA